MKSYIVVEGHLILLILRCGYGEVDTTIGHVPRKILAICSFLRNNSVILYRVTGSRRYLEDLPWGRLEIPCTLKL